MNLCSRVLLPDSLYSQAKVGYYHGNPDTNTETAILSGKTLIRTRKLPVSFRDNIRVSVIV